MSVSSGLSWRAKPSISTASTRQIASLYCSTLTAADGSDFHRHGGLHNPYQKRRKFGCYFHREDEPIRRVRGSCFTSLFRRLKFKVHITSKLTIYICVQPYRWASYSLRFARYSVHIPKVNVHFDLSCHSATKGVDSDRNRRPFCVQGVH